MSATTLWTIRNRMTAIGLAATIAICGLGAIQYLAANSVQVKTNDAATLQSKMSIVNETRLQNVNMLLAAMDSIIDKAEGAIQPEREQVIGAAVAYIETHLAEIAALASRVGAIEAGQSLEGNFAAVAKAIQGDLKTAIETNADDAAFAKIDDVIDDAGEVFAESLTLIESKAQEQMAARLAEADSSVDGALEAVVVASSVALAVLLPLVFVIARGVVSGLAGLTDAMTRLAKGDLETEVPFTGRVDELGTMAGAVQVFKENAAEVERLRAEREQEQQAGLNERRKAMTQLAEEFDASVKGVVETVSATAVQLSERASELAANTSRSIEESSAVNASAEQTNSAVQAVATAAEQLSSSIAEINRQVSDSSRIANTATETARQTNTEVENLAAAAEKIGDVIKLIQDIAEQTNLLALNATIEAARAGDAGKGFAVVASEVKSLANQTAKATEEIAGQISEIQGATANAVDAIRQIAATNEEINSISASIAASVEEQGAATMEISRSAQEAAASVQETSGTIQNVLRSSEETGRTVGLVAEDSGRLNDQLGGLKSQAATFVDRIRAS